MEEKKDSAKGTWDTSLATPTPLAIPNIEQDKIYINGKLAFDISQHGSDSLGSADLEGLPDRTPRTKREVDNLLKHRPLAWEYLYYASCLLSEVQEIAPRWTDYEAGYVSDLRTNLGLQDPLDYVRNAMDQLSDFPLQIRQWFNASIIESAFGRPGEPGNASLISHTARRQVEVQGRMLDWAQTQRNLALAGPFAEVVDLMAQIVGMPVKDFLRFVDNVVAEVDKIPSWVRTEHRAAFSLELTYVMRLDDDVIERINSALDRIRRSLD